MPPRAHIWYEVLYAANDLSSTFWYDPTGRNVLHLRPGGFTLRNICLNEGWQFNLSLLQFRSLAR